MKKSLFFENAKLLGSRFGIIPLMYGSLGLEYLTGEDLNSNDIDILIPCVFLNERWAEFKDVFVKEGYVLIDEYEIKDRAEKELPDKEQLILVYCRSGRRSKIASEELVKLGYTNVKEFGGIIDWPYETVK